MKNKPLKWEELKGNEGERLDRAEAVSGTYNGTAGIPEHIEKFSEMLEAMRKEKDETNMDDMFVYVGSLTKEGYDIQSFSPKAMVRVAANNVNSLTMLQTAYITLKMMMDMEAKDNNPPPASYTAALRFIGGEINLMLEMMKLHDKQDQHGRN